MNIYINIHSTPKNSPLSCSPPENTRKIEEKAGRNAEFAVLSTLAMAFTVMGHTGVGFATLDWLFPYDSFHMPLFIFISGYFFRTQEVCLGNAKEFFFKQCKRLLIPFFAWNLIYGIVSQFAYSKLGIIWSHADEFWYRFLIRPFTYGNCFFEFNAPSWFVLVLFEVKCLNWIFHFVLTKVKGREFVVTIFYLALAVFAVTCARSMEPTPQLIVLTRMLYMMFWFQMGTVYKVFLEKYDNCSNLIYFSLILCIQLIMWIICQGQGIIAGIWNSEFTNGAILTVIAAFTGIAFYLRIAKILSKSIGNSRIVHYISTHTFSIMMHHFLSFTILNVFFWKVDELFALHSFDVYAFQTDLWYRWLPEGLSQFRILYVVAGFTLPLVGCLVWEKLRCKITVSRDK